MATAKKAPTKNAPAKKAAAKKSQEFSLRDSADKAVNIYLGVIGAGIDSVQENIESARKENEKRMKEFEKRGAKLRKELTKRIDDIEVPEFDDVVEDAKAQFSKIQDQVEEVVETVKDKLGTANAA